MSRDANGVPRQVVILWTVVLSLVLSLSELLFHQVHMGWGTLPAEWIDEMDEWMQTAFADHLI